MIYFASDVHLGLKGSNPQEREDRFVNWLKSISWTSEDKLFLLGDIWDFWYEYKDVIPKEGIRVLAELINIMDAGSQVYFFPGNHDIWTFHFFEKLGIHVIHNQPVVMELDGRKVMMGHGDGVGGAKWSYKLMLAIFHSRFCQFLFSLLHPRLAFSIATRWSKSNRYTHTHTSSSTISPTRNRRKALPLPGRSTRPFFFFTPCLSPFRMLFSYYSQTRRVCQAARLFDVFRRPKVSLCALLFPENALE